MKLGKGWLEFVEKTERRFGASPQTGEQYAKEGRIWDLYIVRRWENGRKPAIAGVLISFKEAD